LEAVGSLLELSLGLSARLSIAMARSSLACSAQHVVGAEFDRLVARTPRTTPILIYCYHGNASRAYAQILTDFGFRQAYSIDGGYEAWCSALGS
jgi:rhodanese-related sulfurtransferase